MRWLLDRLVRPLGLRVIRKHYADVIYQHQYAGGYAEYRATQIKYNKRKLDHVWADKTTLSKVVDDLRAHGLGETGICHGARNGFEVTWFREHLGGDIIGTDISETATEFSHMQVWDFHADNPDWLGKFDFVYTNSLDQAMEPARALNAWAKQIKPRGRIYIEHTMAHSATGAGAMDPFGAHPMAMPYLFFIWGRDSYSLTDILEIGAKDNNELRAWIFVLTRADASANVSHELESN